MQIHSGSTSTKLFNYVDSIEGITDQSKLKALINHLDLAVFKYISESETYDAAKTTICNVYVKRTKKLFARYCLATCKQRLDQFSKRVYAKSRETRLCANFSVETAI